MLNFSFNIRNRYLMLVDVFLCVLSFALFTLLCYPVIEFHTEMFEKSQLIILSAIVYGVTMICFSIYRIDWINAGTNEYIKLITSCSIATVICSFLGIFTPMSGHFKFVMASNVGIFVFICAIRFALRVQHTHIYSKSYNKNQRVLIIGAGKLAVMLLHEINQNKNLNYKVVGLIDDDVSRQKAIIYGTKVLGTSEDIEKICIEQNVEEIIFAIMDIIPSRKAEILDVCSKTGKKVKILTNLESTLNPSNKHKIIREVDINDLLERDAINLDNQLLSKNIIGKTVLVTGGSGSIGSEICRQVLKYFPKKLIILDIYENTTYDLENELKEMYPDQNIDVLIASVRDVSRLDAIFKKYKPDYVFHAAAHKHVPLMEFSPCEAIKNNVFGTYNTAYCADKHGVQKFVLISTDKAVNPTNIMGASKRVCEMIIQSFAKNSNTKFVAVRFGNVLGSNGSVIPIFKKQIAAGGPVTVTHPEITRFFMTIPEATQLVLQAASFAEGGEIFVLDMGTPVKIYDLAKKIIRLSGFVPDEDIEIKFSGLRPGEKLYEELLMDEEGLKTTANSRIFVGQPIDITKEELEEKLTLLKTALEKDEEAVKEIVSQVVPTYYQPEYANKTEITKQSEPVTL